MEFLLIVTSLRLVTINRNSTIYYIGIPTILWIVALLIYGEDINPSICVKLLEVLAVSITIYKQRQIKAIHRYLPTDAAKSLVNAFVVSQITATASTSVCQPYFLTVCSLCSVLGSGSFADVTF